MKKESSRKKFRTICEQHRSNTSDLPYAADMFLFFCRENPRSETVQDFLDTWNDEYMIDIFTPYRTFEAITENWIAPADREKWRKFNV